MKLSPQNFLECAEFLGAKLSREAIWAGERCNWFGHQATEPGTGMCGADYYSGTSGIAVFLGHLYAATGEKIFRITAEGAIRQALSRLDHIPLDQRLDFKSGLIGIAHALLDVSRTCNIEKFNALALLILEEISSDALDGKDLEVSPSDILSLLKIHRDHPRDFLLQTALRLGEHLRPVGEDLYGFALEPSQPLAFLELFHATGQEKFQQAAEQTFAYQLKILGALVNRNVDVAESIPAAFGMPFIRAIESNDFYLDGARSVLLSITKNLPNSLSEADMDFSPAQGLTGQADLLIEATCILRDGGYRLSAELIGGVGIDRYKKDDLPWPCGAADGERSGLMTGLAGIGYVYLRLWDSTNIPSLL